MGIVKIDNLDKEIDKLTGEYAKTLKNELNKTLKEVAYHAAGTLKKGGDYNERSGRYTPSWYVTKERGESAIDDAPTYIVHNRKQPWLAHLLEKGYVSRQGKRVKPHVHIAPVDEMVAGEWTDQAIEKAVRKANGG